MTDTSVENSVPVRYSPAYLLRQYVLGLLRINGAIEEKGPDAYGGLDPVVPLSEEPELTQYGEPYLVYGYVLDATNELPARKTGTMTFVIYSEDFGKITEIINVMVEGLGRADESATDVNAFTSTIPQFVGIRFGYVTVSFVEGGSPETSEGGRMSGVVTIRFEYYTNYTDVQTSLV